jgi:hypothetical protein
VSVAARVNHRGHESLGDSAKKINPSPWERGRGEGLLTAAAMTVAFVLLLATPALATPDLRQPRTAGALTVYPDHARRTLFYYPPGELTIAVKDGAFDVHLLHARYTGSAASGDRGATMVRSIFTVRLVMNGPTPLELVAARRELTASIGAGAGTIELRPLPIRRLESAIVYATTALPAGHAEETDAPRPRDGFWRERIYTLSLDATDAQLLSEALERGSLALSVGYAFLADGIASDQPLQELTGTPELVDALKKQLAPKDGESEAGPHIVRAGAVSVTVDAAQAARIVQRIDINDSAPPGYAALDIYCYDFNQGGESPLYEKQIEIDAAGVGGTRVQLTALFSRAHPDLFARSLRFPVAVRLDKPYRFRILETTQDGTQKTSEWRERSSWSELLDVTTVTGATARATTGDDR